MDKKKLLGIIFGCIGGAIVLSIIIIAIVATRDAGNKTKEDINYGTIIEEAGQSLDLSEYNGKNITLRKGGQYILSGDYNGSIIVDADSDVLLILNGVNIYSAKTASIINLQDKPLTLALVEDTTSTLVGGSNAKYGAAIYSSGDIIFSGGNGGIVVAGRIASNLPVISEKNVEVNSGIVIFTARTGMDFGKILTKEKKLDFDLTKDIKSGSIISIANSSQETICQFTTKADLNKLYMVADYLEEEKYFIYADDELLASGVVK